MKKLLVCVAAIAIVACKQEAKVDYAIVSGKIENTKAKKATVRGLNFTQEIDLDENGVFNDTIKLAENGFYSISTGRQGASMYLKVGDKVTVTKDSTGFSFSGDGATESNYLIAKVKNTNKLRGNPVAFYSLEEAAFKAKVNEIMESNKGLLNKLEGADAAFAASELKNLQYDAYAVYDDYKPAHGYYTKNRAFEPSEDFLPEALKNMVYDNAEDYKSSSSYQKLAMNSVMNPIYEGLEDFNNMTPEDLKSLADIKIPALKDQAIDSFSKMALSPANTNLEALYTFFNDNLTSEQIKEDLKLNYDKAQNLTKGKPSPTFVKYENHKGGVTSLTDLKGKYVYVDVWATWCGPCKAEIPSLKKVEKEYHGKNIVFVSTSVDVAKDHGKWTDMVKKEELGGVQLMADNDWKSQFVQDYGINGIPRFILIDPAGNIVSADAPRPSDPKLKDLFNSLEI